MRDRVRIRIEGYNLERLINRLVDEKITVSDVYRERAAVEMNVYRADMANVIDLCERLCYNIINKGPVGQYKYRQTAFKNIFVIAGIVLVFAYCIISGTKLAEIVLIDEAGLTDNGKIAAVLEEMSIKRGTVLSTVDVDAVENRLSREIEHCEYVIVNIKGSVMTVTVTARSEKPPEVGTAPRDIVALCDGVVTRVVAITGTPEVKIGDTVKKGQVLIGGYVEYADGTSEEVYAEGRVYARVSESAEVVFIEERVRYELTGRRVTVTEFDIFGYRVKSSVEIPFEYYDVDSRMTVFSPAPVVMYKVTYFEQVRIVEKVTFESVKDELIEKAKVLAAEKADFIVEDFSSEVTDGQPISVRVTVYGTKVISDVS